MNTLMRRQNESGTQMPAIFSELFDRMVENSFNRVFDDKFWNAPSIGLRNQVPVNVKETDKSYEMEIAAPGYKKEDFKIDVSDDTLTVSLNHNEEKKEQNEKEGWQRQEYRRESFTRSFNLGGTVDMSKIDASYKDGMLTLILPKKENAQKATKTVPIK